MNIKTHKAFTLIEIIVVLAIIAILSSVFFYSGLNSSKIQNIVLSDSENLATFIIDAQNMTSSFLDNVDIVDLVGYGVFFDMNNNSKVESFYKRINNIFNIDNDILLNQATSIEDIVLDTKDSITKICLNGCENFISNENTKLAIYFVKPKPYTYFYFSSDGLNYYPYINMDNNQTINRACIEISADEGQYLRHIDVYYIGQVSSSYGACE